VPSSCARSLPYSVSYSAPAHVLLLVLVVVRPLATKDVTMLRRSLDPPHPQGASRVGVGIAIALSLVGAACDKFVRHAPEGGPPPNQMIVGQICASNIGGPKATVQVWRDANGQVAILELFPDPDAHSRTKSALYDGRGREQLRIPALEEKSSPQTMEFERRHDAVVEDSRPGETLSCANDGGTPDGGN
jgi:hypothetical protein